DHDGTISTLREGWERIMEPMMTKAILGTQFKTVDEKLFNRVKDRVQEFIERTTGIQTIAQMHGLVDLVQEFGLVPKDQILSAAKYKGIFNEELMALACGFTSPVEPTKKTSNAKQSTWAMRMSSTAGFMVPSAKLPRMLKRLLSNES